MQHRLVLVATSLCALLTACASRNPAPAELPAPAPSASATEGPRTPSSPGPLDAAVSERRPETFLASPVSGPARDDLPPPPPRPVEEPPVDLTTLTEVPRLVVDGLGHTSKVRALLYTSDGRSLVTGSYDKTIRVWSASTGELLRTIRGEIGAGPAGRVSALALSEGDRHLAVGGWLGRREAPARSSSEDAFKVRVLDFHSGTTERLLAGHSDVVMSAAFAHRGSRLLTGSGDQSAIVWDGASGQRLATLYGHGGGVTAVAWSPDDRLVATGSVDSSARVWTADGSLRATLTGHTDRVTAAAFTPSGRSVLTASADGTVRLFDASGGAFLKVLTDVRAPIGSLAITPDGLHVLVTTTGGDFASHVIHINTGRRVAVHRGHDNVVLASAISPNGKWAATAGGSDFGLAVWELGSGREEIRASGHGAPVWNVGFRTNGTSVAWSHELAPEAHAQKQLNGPVRHEVPLARAAYPVVVADTASNQTDFVRAVERVGSIEVRTGTGGDDEELFVTVDGRRTATIRRDVTSGFVHRAFGLTPNGEVVVSGGDSGTLSTFSTTTGGKLRDFIGHTGDVLALAISPDGRRLVSGSNDQTVRVWDLESGEALLTIFRAKNREWVAFTPAGYYASSPYGDSYLGFHANRGADRTAAYFPGSALATQLRFELFVRHFLVTGGNIESAIRACNEGLAAGQNPLVHYRFEDLPQFAPPRVYYLDPGTDVRIASDRIEVTAKAHSPSTESIDDMQFLVNGRPLDDRWLRSVGYPRLSKQGREATLRATLPLPEKVNRISVVAKNRYNSSEPVGIDVHRTGGKGELERLYQPNLFVLGVGVSRYGAPGLAPLAYGSSDATVLAKAFEKQNRGLYGKIVARTLTDKDVSRASVLDQIRSLASGAEQKDVAVVFLSGYAAVDASGEYYFLPHDADPARLRETAVSWKELRTALEKLPSKVVLLLDSSHGGAATGTEKPLPIDVGQLLRKSLTAESGLVILTSSTGTESSFESDRWKHGAFTLALLEGLAGKADYDSDRQIWIRELDHYVSLRVPELTRGRQHPTTEIPRSMPNFALTDR